jgi:hypothetical protein
LSNGSREHSAPNLTQPSQGLKPLTFGLTDLFLTELAAAVAQFHGHLPHPFGPFSFNLKQQINLITF